MPAKKYIVGQTFGSLKVISELSSRMRPCGKPERWSLCLCACGRTVEVRNGSIKSGNTTSCGCQHYALISKKLSRHGHSSGLGPSKTYQSWAAMIQRCVNNKSNGFQYYGARGITVCVRWMIFENFLKDMGERPPGKTLGRINNALGYEPGNVAWQTHFEQMKNTRRSRIFTVNGITGCASELSRFFGIHHATALDRIGKGWPPERAFTIQAPARSRKADKL